MRIACCTIEMIALVFLLFVSSNGGVSYTGARDIDRVKQSTETLVSTWGEPDRVVGATDLGFVSSTLATVEVWAYDRLSRTAVVRGDVVVSVRVG